MPFSPVITRNAGVPDPEVRACVQLRRNGESDLAGSGSKREKKGELKVQGFQEMGT